MSTYDTTATKANDRTARVRPTYIFLGVDANGSHHVAHVPSETIRIVHPDGSRATKDLTDPECPAGGIDAYVEYIEDLGGWDDRRYGRDLIGEIVTAHRETQR